MAQTTSGIHSVLSHPRVYWLSQVVLGGPGRHKMFVREYLRPRDGMRILDIGCGSGQMTKMMPQTDYVGLDPNPRYIEMARKQFGLLGEFVCSSLADADLESRSFDAVTAIGLLHHLGDNQVDQLMAFAAGALDEGGRLLTLDPTHLDDASSFANWLIRNDRGQAVRSPEGYEALAGRRFGDVALSIERKRLLPPILPTRYPVAVMECRRPL